MATLSEVLKTAERWELPTLEAPPSALADRDPSKVLAEALTQGLEQGRQQGYAQGLAEAAEVSARLAALWDAMAQPYRALDQVVAQELIGLVMTVATQVLRRELTIDSGDVEETVQRALAVLSDQKTELEIFLNPADCPDLENLLEEVPEGRMWRLRPDHSILPGGCRLKSPTSYVDATVEKQLADVTEELLFANEQAMEQS